MTSYSTVIIFTSILTIPSFNILLGFDQGSQTADLLPFKFIQLGSHMVADKVKLFSQLPLLKSAGMNGLALCDLCILQHNTNKAMLFPYLYIFHVCVVKLFSKMLIFFKEIDNFPEIAVIM